MDWRRWGQGELFEPGAGEFVARPEPCSALIGKKPNRIEVLSFAPFSLHQQRKGGRQPGRIPGGLLRREEEASGGAATKVLGQAGAK